MQSAQELEEGAARVLADGPVPLGKLSAVVPAARQGKLGRVSVSAMVRWITDGKQGVYLDGLRLAGKGWCSSQRALARFSARLIERELGGVVKVLEPLKRESAADKANRELDALRSAGEIAPCR